MNGRFDHSEMGFPGGETGPEDTPEMGAQKPEDQAVTLRQLAAFHLAHGRLETAAHLSDLALWLAPDVAANMRLGAHVAARAGRPSEGLKLLRQARKIKGAVTLTDWLTIGAAFARFGDLKTARELFALRTS